MKIFHGRQERLLSLSITINCSQVIRCYTVWPAVNDVKHLIIKPRDTVYITFIKKSEKINPVMEKILHLKYFEIHILFHTFKNILIFWSDVVRIFIISSYKCFIETDTELTRQSNFAK